MPTLSIRHGLCGGRATVIATDEWPGGTDAYRWVGILASVLVYAFLERPVIVISPPGVAAASFVTVRRGNMRPVHRRPNRPWPLGSYWFGTTDSCPEALLWQIADEGEFELGELWVTAIPDGDLAWADAVVRSARCPDLALPATSEELIAIDGPSDGRALVWLNPSRPLTEIADAVREIAERRGWTVGDVDIVGGGSGDSRSGT